MISKELVFLMVSTGYFTVSLFKSLKKMESLARMVRLYLPKESVIVPLPDVLITATASNGFLADISYTVPLMVTN
jgi:hypothetical protein